MKIWLTAAACLVLVGCILFIGVMANLGWDFTKLATVKYETNTHEISETFDGISISTDTADVVFELSDDGNCRVECREEANARHSVTVEDGTLSVVLLDNRSVKDLISLNFASSEITVYLPKIEYASLYIDESTGNIEIPGDFTFEEVDISVTTGDVDFGASAHSAVKIKTNTGNIDVHDIAAATLDLAVTTGKVTVAGVAAEGNVTVEASTGKVHLSDIQCRNVISSGNSGGITLNNVIAVEMFSIERSTGDVTLNGCDAAEIYVKTDTGDVTGNLCTEKVFITETDTGRVAVPKTITGGKCEIITNTGDIDFS